VRDVADAVLAAVDADVEKVFVDERLGQVDRHIGSTDKLERLTGWRARTSFEHGLEQTVAWYRENEVWWKSLRARDSVSSS
jgi:dTDP-glucose 4,6-dehydratase